jgi:hypothetical protein
MQACSIRKACVKANRPGENHPAAARSGRKPDYETQEKPHELFDIVKR